MHLETKNKQVWLSLYAASEKLKQLAPWKWMDDEQIFAIEPLGDETAYCCIMGALGELLGINVYLGTEGLDGYYDNITIAMGGGDAKEILFTQKCLQATFENRENLSPDDLRQIKELGLKYRGKQQWPVFRECSPGWYPWYLTEKQAVYLTKILEQVIEVAERVKKNPAMLAHPDREEEEVYFSRKEKRLNNKSVWEDGWLFIEPDEESPETGPLNDPDLQNAVKQINEYPTARYKLNCFIMPMYSAVMDEETDRPFFPLCILWVAHDSKMILDFQLCKLQDIKQTIASSLLEEVKKHKARPSHILVPDEETFHSIIETFTDKVEIPVSVSTQLQAVLQDIKESMGAQFGF